MISLFKSKEEKLIAACLNGDMRACKEFYECYAPNMLVVCMQYTKDKDAAEDVLQDAFIKIFDKLKTYKGEGALAGWVRRIVVNTAIKNYHRSNRLYPVVDIDIIGDEMIDEQDSGDNFPSCSREEIMEIIHELSPRYKIVFNLYAIEGYSHKEVAEELGISEGTSKSQLARARAILKEELKKKQGIINKQYVIG